MKTTPEQLELAADILRHNKPWEYVPFQGKKWCSGMSQEGLLDCLKRGYEIRPKPLDFAPIPEGAERHNPSGAVPETVGADHRLLVVGEEMPQAYQYLERDGKTWTNSSVFSGEKVPKYNRSTTVRVPSGTPYPCGSRVVDGNLVKPWKPRFKVGDRVRQIGDNAVWEVKGIENEGFTLYRLLNNGYHATCWRKNEQLEPAPWTLTRHIPGFRPLRDGEEWHRTDWTEEMLPHGYRPLLLGEARQIGDEHQASSGWFQTQFEPAGENKFGPRYSHCRTRRPLPEPAPEPAKVPLGPEDVPPGSTIRYKLAVALELWWLVLSVSKEGMYVFNPREAQTLVKWSRAFAEMEIHRPGNLDANGKPVFQPCWKLQ